MTSNGWRTKLDIVYSMPWTLDLSGFTADNGWTEGKKCYLFLRSYSNMRFAHFVQLFVTWPTAMHWQSCVDRLHLDVLCLGARESMFPGVAFKAWVECLFKQICHWIRRDQAVLTGSHMSSDRYGLLCSHAPLVPDASRSYNVHDINVTKYFTPHPRFMQTDNKKR